MKNNSIHSTEGGSEGRACHRGSGRGKGRALPFLVLAWFAVLGDGADAQTKIDLRTQAKAVDFSGAGTTKPSKTGTVLPAACSVGETFLNTAAPAGQNFYACTSANVWSLQGAAIPNVTNYANMVLATNGTALIWQALGGDISGAPTSVTVSKLQGRAVSPAAPAAGQALAWNPATVQWEPQNLGFPQISGTVTSTQIGSGIDAAKIGAGTVSSTAFGYLANVTSDMQAQLNGKASTNHTHTTAGDVNGSLGSLTVTGLQGRAVATTAPANGQSLVWNATTSQWQPQNQYGGVLGVFGRTGDVVAQSGDYSFSQISGTVTDSQVATGVNANKIGSGTVSNTAFGYLANVSSDVQAQLNGKANSNQPLTGDVGGVLGATTVMGLRNRALSATAPSNGQTLAWNSSTSQWEPQNPAGGVPSVFGRTGAVTAQSGDYSFGQISGAVTDAQVGTGINANKIGSGSVSNTTLGYLSNVSSDVQSQLNGKAAASHTHTLTGDVSGDIGATTVTALQSRAVSPAAPANGQSLVWNASLSQWQPQNQNGGVSGVFGRTGAVAAQAGDYSFSQISGTVTDSQVATGVNANKIGSGNVSNTVFGYLGNVTSDIQSQLNSRAPTTQPLSGDLSGSLASPTVAAIQNRAISPTAPANGQSLVWNSAAGQWQPQNQSGGVSGVFGRTGAVVAQTGDYSFSQISGTVTDPQVATGINATKIGGGAVSNTAFSYLASATSDVQAQLNGKSATTHTHSIGGDVTGSSLAATTVTSVQSRAVASTAPANGQALIWNSSAGQWQPQYPGGASQSLGGDLLGTVANATVGSIQNRVVSTTPPTNGQVMTWNSATNRWEAQTLPNSSNGSYSSSFASQTTVSIPGTVHQLGTANLLVACYDTSTPPQQVLPNSVSVNQSTYDVTITFLVPQSGRCIVTAGGAGGGGGGGGASMVSQLGDFSVTWTSGAMLTVGPNCSAATPCNVRLGSNVYRYVSGTSITVSSGTGTAYIYVDANGVLTVGHNLTLSCVAPCAAVPGVSAFPVNSIPLYTWTATGGAWDASGGVDERAMVSGKLLTAGPGIVTLDTSSATNISVDAAVVPRYLTATASLSFGSIVTGSCAVDQTFPLTGASVGDSVAPGWPSPAPGLIGSMWISAPNTVSVRLCNFSGGTVSPAAGSYRVTVVRSF
jgi:uncharacterized protein YdbL (DUF1318 family)